MKTPFAILAIAIPLAAQDPDPYLWPTPQPHLADAEKRAQYWQVKDEADRVLAMLQEIIRTLCGPDEQMIPDQRPQTTTPGQPLCVPKKK